MLKNKTIENEITFVGSFKYVQIIKILKKMIDILNIKCYVSLKFEHNENVKINSQVLKVIIFFKTVLV